MYTIKIKAAVAALLVVGFLSAGFLHSQDAKQPGKGDKSGENKDDPKKAEPKKAVPGFIDIDDFIKKLPPDLPKEQVDRIRASLEQAKKRFAESQKRIDDLKRQPLPNLVE